MKRIILVLVLGILCGNLFAQREYKINIDSSKLVLKGTSTMHDWEAYTKDIKGHVIALIEDGLVKKLDKVDVAIEAKNIMSETSGLAKQLHKSLDVKAFPNISFKMLEVKTLSAKKLDIEGILTIKGVSKRIIVSGDISFKKQNGDIILVLGSKKVNMRDFNIDPPKFLFGMFKTGDEVKVEFSIYLIN